MNTLTKITQFILFVTSYTPLFFLIILKQISTNVIYLNWGGLNINSVLIWVEKFGLSIILSIISIVGLLGCKLLFRNLQVVSANGDNVKVHKVDNKNNESIGYIATYIVPFLFQNFNSWYELTSLSFLLFIIYKIYINSNLLIVNPILSFRYSLFEIEYIEQNGKTRKGLIITKSKYIEEDDIIKIYEIGFKLYYCTVRNIK